MSYKAIEQCVFHMKPPQLLSLMNSPGACPLFCRKQQSRHHGMKSTLKALHGTSKGAFFRVPWRSTRGSGIESARLAPIHYFKLTSLSCPDIQQNASNTGVPMLHSAMNAQSMLSSPQIKIGWP